MRMEVDMSDYAMREILSIECKGGHWKLVDYLSKSLKIRWKEITKFITRKCW